MSASASTNLKRQYTCFLRIPYEWPMRFPLGPDVGANTRLRLIVLKITETVKPCDRQLLPGWQQ